MLFTEKKRIQLNNKWQFVYFGRSIFVNEDIAGGEITVNDITAFKVRHSITRITTDDSSKCNVSYIQSIPDLLNEHG